MNDPIIKLSQKILIDCLDKAAEYNLADLYNSCFNELVESISWYHNNAFKNSTGISASLLITLSTYLNIFENKFYNKLSSKEIFITNSINTIQLEKSNIRVRSFDIEEKKLELIVYAISIPVILLYTVGNNIIIRTGQQNDSEYNNVATLELNSGLTIHNFKID